jgi:hypothetical protein
MTETSGLRMIHVPHKWRIVGRADGDEARAVPAGPSPPAPLSEFGQAALPPPDIISAGSISAAISVEPKRFSDSATLPVRHFPCGSDEAN